MSYQVGDVVRLRAAFTDLSGVPADPTAVTVKIRNPAGTVTTPAAVNDATAVGAFYYDLAVTSSGTWTYRFEGTGAVTAADEATIYVERSAFSDDVSLTSSLICEPWATTTDICAPCNELEPELLENMLLVASETLYVLSGRQFRGSGCEATVRPEFPCGVNYGPCGGPFEIVLPHYPVTEVTEVKVRQTHNGDLETLTEDQYRLDNHSTLVRLQDADDIYRGWPRQEIRQNSNGIGRYLEVTYTYGQAPPLLGKQAAAVLACEFALACDPDAATKCRLPKKVQSIVRQGVSMEFIDPEQFLAEDLTGIYETDIFLRVFNPAKLRRRASVWSPDLPAFRTVPFGGS
jgi:hypothetical protein